MLREEPRKCSDIFNFEQRTEDMELPLSGSLRAAHEETGNEKRVRWDSTLVG